MTDFSREATIHHSFASRQHSAETVFVRTCVCPPVCNTAGGFLSTMERTFPTQLPPSLPLLLLL